MAGDENREPLPRSGSLPFRAGFAQLAATLLAACGLAVPAAGAPKTTAPDQPYRIDVTVTDSSISIERDRFTAKDGTTRWPRGALIDFIVKNVGKRPHVARFALVSQHYFSQYEARKTSTTVGKTPIRPGQVRHLAVNFYFRGSFAFELMAGSRPISTAKIVIF
ncbi:MAG TPA: hypothetical protein VFA88_04870 [Gaiellaceae bacterium]|nr:hypothetical protein [Gaiellaceae bacterium]